uniref:Putative tpa: cuticle protein n=1 Tax=Aedes albopictus TaxID=7160 RepID=A0A023ENZ1_AEDAL
MKLILLSTVCLFSIIVQTIALPMKVSKPQALVTSREDRSLSPVAPIANGGPVNKDISPPTKPGTGYFIRVIPKEQDEFERLMDFFAVGEIDSPSELAGSPQKTSYGSYSPRQDDLTEPLLPPPVEQNEPNYYSAKPRKSKSKKYIPNQKLVNIKNTEHIEDIEKTENERSRQNAGLPSSGEIDEVDFLGGLDLEKLLASAWLTQADADAEAAKGKITTKEPAKPAPVAELNTGEYMPSQQRRMDENTRWLPSENEGRIGSFT